jgi:hypothetical protein
VRKPGISTGDGPNFGELPIRETDEDRVRESAEDLVRQFDGKTFTNQGRSKVKVAVPKIPGLECELVAGL